MNKIKSEIEKVEEGCGLHWEDETQEYWCGDLDYSDKPKIHYCEICKAKLEALKFADDQHEKFVKDLKKKIQEVKNHHEKYVLKESDIQFIHDFIDELNSEVKK